MRILLYVERRSIQVRDALITFESRSLFNRSRRELGTVCNEISKHQWETIAAISTGLFLYAIILCPSKRESCSSGVWALGSWQASSTGSLKPGAGALSWVNIIMRCQSESQLARQLPTAERLSLSQSTHCMPLIISMATAIHRGS